MTKKELNLLKIEMTALDLELESQSNDSSLSRYIEIGYTLMAGNLFGFGDFEINIKAFSEATARALRGEISVVGSATRAVLVYNSAFILYQEYLRTTSEVVAPNAERALSQAENKATRKKEKAEAKKQAKHLKISKGKGKNAHEAAGDQDAELEGEDASMDEQSD